MIKFLFFDAYRYRHENEELWRDGCLQAIDARRIVVATPYLDEINAMMQERTGLGETGETIVTSGRWVPPR